MLTLAGSVSCLLTSIITRSVIYVLLLPFLEPTVNIVPHYSEDNTLTKVIVRGINLGVGTTPYVVNSLYELLCNV